MASHERSSDSGNYSKISTLYVRARETAGLVDKGS
jgi:hypothetical protein